MLCLIQQALRKRLQGVMARLGSEVKDGGVAREAEDAINELQRQMGDFERSVSDHLKTLEMTRRLQQAMEEVMDTAYISFSYSDYYFVIKHEMIYCSSIMCVYVNSISSGARRRVRPSLVSGSFPRSVAARTPSLFSTSSLRSSSGQRFRSRRRGSVRSQSWLSDCTVSLQPVLSNL